MKRRHLGLIVAAVVVVVLGVFVAGSGANALVGGWGHTRGMMAWSGQTTAATGPVGACGQLMNNPDAVKAMRALRDEHREDMQAWWQKYGSDPNSTAARQALQKLRTEHWQDMQKLFRQLGIDLPSVGPGGMMGGSGAGSASSGGCGQGGGTSAPPGTTGPGMMGSWQ